jgi:outer membrane immunogenic protein
VLAGASTASAQNWKGLYVGGFVGGGFPAGDRTETVSFDTNLDGTFNDTVRTAAGADAFSPGFCGGFAINAVAASGCTTDKNRNRIDVGGRVGYDWQMGRVVVGGLLDVSRNHVSDSVTAFSTTPAFYAFTRELNTLTGFRGRVGVGNSRVIAYGTAGGAWANVEQSFTTSNRVNTFVAVNQNDDRGKEGAWGYQAGGGAEVRIGGHWSLLGEYLFTSLDNRQSSTIRSQGPAPATNAFILVNAAGTELQRTDRFDIQAARVSLSYRF